MCDLMVRLTPGLDNPIHANHHPIAGLIIWAFFLSTLPFATANASPSAGVLCSVSGDSGNIVICPLNVTSSALNEPAPTSLQMGIHLPSGLELNQMTDGEFCVGPICVPYTLPLPNVKLQSGHILSLDPPALWKWKDGETGESDGELILFNQSSPSEALSNAFYQAGESLGNPVVLEFHITLTETIPVGAPLDVTLEWIIISDEDGQPLRVKVEGEPAVLITSEITLTCTTNGEVCNDGDLCTVNDSCIVGVCFGQPVDCSDGNLCTSESCDPVEGCSVAPKGGPCDDDDPCSIDDVCGGGICLPGSAILCEDNVPCTLNKCVYGVGCDFNTPLDCDDGDICTDEICEVGVGCIQLSDITETCADPNPCTLDVCDPVEGCIHTPIPDTGACDDGNACTTDETCTAGVCLSAAPLDCSDGNPCTTDYCDPDTGCVQKYNLNACDDGNACTTVDECDKGICEGEGSLDCDDDNPCTKEICIPTTGCTSVNQDGEACDDGLVCNGALTPDVCQGGACIGAPCPCAKNADCLDDADKCNGSPSCHPFLKVCINGSPLVCEDAGGPCMSPLCDPILGICTFINEDDESPCTDGSLCTSGGSCWNGDCLSNLVGCNDNNYCTSDSCSFEDGSCLFELLPNDAPCSDGDICTGNDTCISGLCTGLANTNCDDGNPCTDDICLPEAGCTYEYNTNLCEDGNACTFKDTCLLGECLSGAATDCNDDDLCTVDICKATEGCLHPELDCNDDTLCNGEETCHPIFGCEPSAPLVCADDDDCTSDGCDAKTGCAFYDVCGPGPFTLSYSPMAIEGGVDRTLTLTGTGFSPQTLVIIEGAIYVEDSDFDEEELVLMEFVSETEIKARFIGPIAEGNYDITVVDGLWNQKFVEGLEVLNPILSPGGMIEFITPQANAKVYSAGEAVDIEVQVNVTDVLVAPGSAYIRFSLDGVEQGLTTETVFTFTALTPGRKHLSAALVNADGNPYPAEAWKTTLPIKVITPCSFPSDCYESVCSNQACDTECKYGPSYSGCCASDSMCGPDSVCVDGVCTDCEIDADCVEGNTCTVDRCEAGVCIHEEVENCCAADSDCDDESPCTLDYCITSLGQCDVEIDTVEGCCTSSLDCSDSSPCTLDFCIGNECRYGPHPTLSTCCSVDDDCIEGSVCIDQHCVECTESYNTFCDDGDLCTVTSCDFSTNKCLNQEVPDCCEVNTDCDDENSCTSNTCNTTFMTCFFGIPDDGCCDIDEHCDDNVPCNMDVCLKGSCRHGPNGAFPDCCSPGAIGLSYLNCNDQNPCTQDICNPATFECSITDPDGVQCCTYSEECEDSDDATFNLCIDGICEFPVDPTYCENVLDCDDENPCTTATCVDETCIFTPLPGCCITNFNCNDGDPCSKDICDPDLAVCNYETVANCCEVLADCPPAGPCQDVACIGVSCRYFNLPGCCVSNAECDDGNSCTDDLCVNNVCSISPAPGCSCDVNADCNDGDLCTSDKCTDGICQITESENCCSSASECDDGNECTNDLCLAGNCKNFTQANCCTIESDCNDYDTCTSDTCENGTCSYTALEVCIELPGVLHSFTTGIENEGFSVDTTPKDTPGWKLSSGKAALVLSTGPPLPWVTILNSPIIDATDEEFLHLQWDQTLPAAAGTPGDELEVRLSTDGGALWTVVYAHNPAGPGAQSRISMDLSAVAANESSLRLAFVWDAEASSGGAHWVVDNVVLGPGSPPFFVSQDELLPVIAPNAVTKVPVTVMDTDFEALVSLSVLDAPDFVVLESDLATPPQFNGELIFTPTYAHQGAYTMTLHALDENNLSTVLEYTFQVN